VTSASPDLARAYLLLRHMSHTEEAVTAGLVGALIAAQERPDRLVRGLGAVINELVVFVDEAYQHAGGDVTDHLHTFQPAIVTRLSRLTHLDADSVPVMAGVLTAASLRLDCYEWRLHLGPMPDVEIPAWAFTAFYLCDLIGHVRGDPDYALDLIGSAVDGT
jgi:hypothetical protein